MRRRIRSLGSRLLPLALAFWFVLAPADHGQAAALPESASISGITGHAQSYNLSCESRSAVDWAAYWGVSIAESEFLTNLPHSDNPDFGFVGNPNDPWGYIPPYSYGVHADPVAAGLRRYGLQAEARHGMKWKALRAEIAEGRPVIVWIIGQMWRGYPQQYTDSQGRSTTVAPYEHTMILVGYDPVYVQLLDAYSGLLLIYPISTFQESWAALGNMAVTGQGKAEEVPAAPTPEVEGKTYTVQPGDYLVKVARQFDTTWLKLVEANDLPYPYTIYPGQTLRLPEDSQEEQPPEATPAPSIEADTDEPPETYTVQPGDYLKGIADRFGLDWTELAERNGLGSPYVIYPGQTLRLK